VNVAEFDPRVLFSEAMIRDPYPVIRELRPHTPLRLEADGRVLYPLMKYEHVYGALRDHETFSSQGDGQVDLALIGNDPPRHTHLRRIVNKVFTPRRIAEAEPWITALSTELLDEMGHGEVDFVDGFTVPLPVKVIAKMLGIPGEDYRKFKDWSDAVLGGGPESGPGAMSSMGEMMQYFGAMGAKRREEPGEDLITALVSAEVEGEVLQEWEMVSFCILLLVAGNETTTNLMSNMLNILAHRPDLWARLKADRSLVEPMIEETLRYESPVQLLFRRVTHDVEVGGVPIPQGSSVVVYFGAANRDPDGFEQPEEFRLDRQLNNHVAFGYGIHFCLGAPLARTEARITLNALLDRFATVSPGSEAGTRLSHSPIVFGFRKLPLVLTP
jgi:hypothetical protein